MSMGSASERMGGCRAHVAGGIVNVGPCDTVEVGFERVGRLRLPFIRYTRRCWNVRHQGSARVFAVEFGRCLASLSRPHPPSTLLAVDFRDLEDDCDRDSYDVK